MTLNYMKKIKGAAPENGDGMCKQGFNRLLSFFHFQSYPPLKGDCLVACMFVDSYKFFPIFDILRLWFWAELQFET